MRGTAKGDQLLLIVTMGLIAALVLAGLLVLVFSPSAKVEVVIPLVSLGVTAINSLAAKGSFPPQPSGENELGLNTTSDSRKPN